MQLYRRDDGSVWVGNREQPLTHIRKDGQVQVFGKQELVAINEALGEMAGMMRGEARGNGVSVRTELKDDLPVTVADRVQLQQVLMNLMLNGIEAMKDTGGVLTVKSQLGENGQIEISVKDTGPRLPAGEVDQIFDAFFTTKLQGSAWAWQSVSRSSNRKAAGFGPTATARTARRSTSPCQRLPRKQTLPWMPRDLAFGRPSRRSLMHDRRITHRQMISRQVAE
jgi:signal transduction histidine kinase